MVRIWDALDPAELCNQHLLGEHNELHCMWQALARQQIRDAITSSLSTGNSHPIGWLQHNETRRWKLSLAGLAARHEQQVAEFARRGFRHQSPLPFPPGFRMTKGMQPAYIIDDRAAQIELLLMRSRTRRKKNGDRVCHCEFTLRLP